MHIKRLAFLGLLVVFIVVISILWQRSRQKQHPPVQPTITIPQSFLPFPITTNQPAYQAPAVEAGLLQALPVYTAASKPQLKTLASSFALFLGINGQPQEIPSTQGVVYVWTNNNQAVIAREGLSTISFGGNNETGDAVNLPLETYYAAADRFTAALHLSDQIIQLTRVDPQYFRPSAGEANEVSSMSQATSVQLNYQYALNGVPVYVGTSTRPSLFVRLNAKADVVALTAIVLPSFTARGEMVPLIPYADAVQSLLRGEGRLTDLVSGDLGDQPYFFDSPPQASNVQDVKIAYYYSPQQDQLVPVYVFKGVGKINNKTVNTTTLVSAVK
jgi:hypothetical protein